MQRCVNINKTSRLACQTTDCVCVHVFMWAVWMCEILIAYVCVYYVCSVCVCVHACMGVWGTHCVCVQCVCMHGCVRVNK